MIAARGTPKSRAMTGPSWWTQYMLKAMWSRLPCSQPALRMVHQRP